MAAPGPTYSCPSPTYSCPDQSPPLSLLCSRRVPPVCPASALPLSMLTSLSCTLPLPAPLIPLVAACCSPLYCPVHCPAAIPRCCPSASSRRPPVPFPPAARPLPASRLPFPAAARRLPPITPLPFPSLTRRRGSHPSPAASSILTFLGWLGPQL